MKVAQRYEDRTGIKPLMAPDGEFKPYDFRLDLRNMFDHPFFEERHEVKHDLASERTGNVAIEYACNGKPSGVMTSSADIWDIVVKTKVYAIKRTVLLAEVMRAVFRNSTMLRKGGDGGKARVLLIEVSELPKIADFILNL